MGTEMVGNLNNLVMEAVSNQLPNLKLENKILIGNLVGWEVTETLLVVEEMEFQYLPHLLYQGHKTDRTIPTTI